MGQDQKEIVAALKHGAFKEVFPSVFFLTGSFCMTRGMTIDRNMTVIRDGDSLTLVNSIELDDEGLEALQALGEVCHVVKLGVAHGSDDAFYLKRYGATYWANKNARANAKIDRTLSEDESPSPRLQYVPLRETIDKKLPCGAFFLAKEETLLVCDAFQNWRGFEHTSLLARLLIRARLWGEARIGFIWLKRMRQRGAVVENDYERLLALPFKHLLSAHGEALMNNAHEACTTEFNKVFKRAPNL